MANVAPEFQDIVITSPVNEGDLATFSGMIVDPSTSDTFTLRVDWGDGAVETFNYAAGTTSFSETHRYVDDSPTGSYEVLASLGDEDAPLGPLVFGFEGRMTFADADFDIGDRFTGAYSVDPTVLGVAHPEPTLSMQYVVHQDWDVVFPDKGYAFTGTFSNIAVGNDAPFAGGFDRYSATLYDATSVGISLPSGRDLFFVQFDVSDSGDPPELLSDDSIQITPPELALASNIGGRLVFLEGDQPSLVLDSLFLATPVGPQVGEVIVNNVAPTPIITSISSPLQEGASISVTGTASDPAGGNDTLTYAWQVFKDGASTAFASASGVDQTGFSFTPDDNGSYQIVLTVSDEDGGSATVDQTISVANVAPGLQDIVITSPVNEGDLATFSGVIVDPSTSDTFTLRVDWGDGAVKTFNYAAGTTSFSETHRYVDDSPTGSFEVHAGLADGDTAPVSLGLKGA